MKSRNSTVGAVLFTVFCMFNASAALATLTTYSVGSASVRDACSHGLWTSQSRDTGCYNKYDIQPDATLVVDDEAGTAVLRAIAINGLFERAEIEMTFSGMNTLDEWLNKGGVVKKYQDFSFDDWLFFEQVTGSIRFTKQDGEFSGLHNITNIVSKTAFQLGVGASLKSGGLGASTWFYPSYWSSYGPESWDLNLSLAKVPEPGTLSLGLLAMGGLLLRRKCMRTAA